MAVANKKPDGLSPKREFSRYRGAFGSPLCLLSVQTGQALMLIGEACPSTCDFVLIHMPPSCRGSEHKIWSAAEACCPGRFQVWAGEGDPHARACASLCFYNCQSVTTVLQTVHQSQSVGREKLLSVLTEAGSAWLIHMHQFSCV